MKTKVYNLEGQQTGEMEMADKIFSVKPKISVIHSVFVAQMNNQRQPWADTKSKGEVRGGGRKPWAQKGTGRARHGSIRSPLWKGGGVVFGPLSVRNYTAKINKNTRRLALKMCLSDKVASGNFWVVDGFNFIEQKTRLFSKFLRGLSIDKKTCLVLATEQDEKVLKITSNIKNIKTMRPEDINVMEVLNQQEIVVSREGIKKIEETLKNR